MSGFKKFAGILFLAFLGGSFTGSPSLLDQYRKRIDKVMTRKLQYLDVSFTFHKSLEQPQSFSECYQVSCPQSGRSHRILLGSIYTCDLGGCTAAKVKASERQSREYFDYLLALDDEGKIEYLGVLNYFSDYGYEMTSKGYLSQFLQKNLCDFTYTESPVDAISGATISCDALTDGLSNLCEALQ